MIATMMKLIDVNISNCGTGISAPADAHIEAERLNITECKKAIELRDPPSILQYLGLSPSTPNNELAIVLREANDRALSLKDLEDIVSGSDLPRWLTAGANITTVSTGIFQLVQGGLIQSIISLL